MSACVTALAGAKARDRSIEGRRAARREKFERERLVVDSLNRGVSVAEIAARLGVTEKRMRALVSEILARRAPPAPEEYAALQASRLNEALLVAMSAMSPANLKAVALVVRIVRELDRYHGFVPLPHAVGKVAGDPRTEIRGRRMGCGKQECDGGNHLSSSCKPAGIEAAGHTPSVAFGDTFPDGAEEGAAADAPCRDRPEMASQAPEKPQFTPANDATPDASDEALGSLAGPAEALDELDAPRIERPQKAPQEPEKAQSAPENAMAPGGLDEGAPVEGPSAPDGLRTGRPEEPSAEPFAAAASPTGPDALEEAFPGITAAPPPPTASNFLLPPHARRQPGPTAFTGFIRCGGQMVYWL